MTDRDQCAFEEALRVDLNAARQQVMVLTDQLREAHSLNETLSYKVDFLTQEVGRVTASREQYERVSIRVATFAESVASVAIKQLQDLQDEIKSAAFAKVPGAVLSPPPASVEALRPHPVGAEHEPSPSIDDIDVKALGKTFGAGYDIPNSGGLLPPMRFGNGSR